MSMRAAYDSLHIVVAALSVADGAVAAAVDAVRGVADQMGTGVVVEHLGRVVDDLGEVRYALVLLYQTTLV
jgi:hypothetical protein